MQNNIPARRVHLDFHTSEHIKNIGSRFNSETFKRALEIGRINEITLFAKCHHGWCYYPTQVGQMHPNLNFDLLSEQLKVCKELGVKANIYITGAWSANDAEAHPEWNVLDFKTKEPVYINMEHNANESSPRPFNSWKLLCLSGKYAEHIIEITKEICDRYEVDGLFYDIACLDFPCVCGDCSNERYLLHLLYASPVNRGNVILIEDMPEIHNTFVRIRLEDKVKEVRLIPQNVSINYMQDTSGLTFTVDKFSCHQLVEICY